MYPGSSVRDDLFFFFGFTVLAREFLRLANVVNFVKFFVCFSMFVSVFVLLAGTVVLLRFPPRGPLEHTCCAGQGTLVKHRATRERSDPQRGKPRVLGAESDSAGTERGGTPTMEPSSGMHANAGDELA